MNYFNNFQDSGRINQISNVFLAIFCPASLILDLYLSFAIFWQLYSQLLDVATFKIVKK